MSIYKYGMLLFCKQAVQGRHIVYFVELDTLENVQPRVHRYAISRGRFNKIQPGQVFRLEAKGIRIVHVIYETDYALSQIDYELLMELKHLRFGVERTHFLPQNLFTFREMCDLLGYREAPARRAALGLLCGAAYALCGIVPLVLYVLLIAAKFLGSGRGSSYSAPLTALGALPLMIFLVVFLYTLCSTLLLQWHVTRYGLLRSHALKTGGMKRRIGVSRAAANKLVIAGGVCLGVCLAALIVSFFV